MNMPMLLGKSKQLILAESVAFQKALDEARRTIRELTEGKTRRDLTIGELREDNRQAVETVKKLEFALEMLENSVERLERVCRNKDALLDSFAREQKAGTAERQALRSLLTKRNGELEALKQALATAREAQDDRQASLEKNQLEAADLRQEIAQEQFPEHGQESAPEALLLQTAEEMEGLLRRCHGLERENAVLRKEAEWFWKMAPHLQQEA